MKLMNRIENQPEQPERLERRMTLEDVAAAYQVSVRTVQNWVANEGIPYIRFGRTLRFSPHDLELWEKERASKPRGKERRYAV